MNNLFFIFTPVPEAAGIRIIILNRTLHQHLSATKTVLYILLQILFHNFVNTQTYKLFV